MSDLARARVLLSGSEEILLLVEAATRLVVDANDTATRELRYAIDDLIGRPITDLECALQDAFYWDDVAGGRLVELHEVEGLLARGDGEMLPVTKSITVHETEGGALLVLRASDARASTAAADELEASTSLLRAIFESTADGLLVLELDGRIMNFNHRFAQIWSLAGDSMRDDRSVLRHMVRMCRLSRGEASPWRVLLSRDEDEVEAQLSLRDERTIRVRARPLLMQDQVRGRVLTCIDITERIRHEQELAAARDAAAASERAKASFLAMMSHEIRTPMAGILGMTEIAAEAAVDAQQKRFIEMAHASAEGLLVIINDLLDFSKIEAGKFVIESIPFDCAALLEETLQPLRWQAANRRLSLDLDNVGDPPRWLVGDPTRIRQILINLIGNALKFTEQGGVSVRVTATPADDGRVLLRIAVVDTGIGISPERQRSIFEAFTQSDAQIGRRFGGTGLGLTICARLCELMGGRIWVDSVPGHGSTFCFELPLGRADEQAAAELAAPVPDAGHQGLRVLLAEDTEVNQVFLSHTLRRAGHEVTLVDNGAAAVEAVLAGGHDVVLMDVQMPGMDGFEATERIRAAGETLPIVGLTAHAMEGIRDECLSHGMTDYLSKPVRSPALLAMLARVADPAAGQAEARPAAGEGAPEPVSEAPPQPVNRAEAVANLGGDEGLWRELIGMLWEQADTDLPLIRAGLDAADAQPVRDVAHRLKSSLAVVGAEPAAAACAEIEAQARRDDLDAARRAFEDLERHYAALCAQERLPA
ncbi:MAG: response regulator [Rhodocyclaceae bacterium]|nr:response regulator [Rhodocyclaceae bacterium]